MVSSMINEITMYFLLFIIYSMIGWIMETVYTLITDKVLSNRGFLIGPICPIYGCGAVAVVLFLSKYTTHPLALFILSIAICSVLEYFTSYIMEKLFKARWWDYSNNKYNINGRICLETMVPFGLIACLLVYVINPFFTNILNSIPTNITQIIAIIIGILFLIDIIMSFNIVNNFKKTIKKVSIEDKTEDINKYIRNLISQKSVLHRRLIKAFPKIKSIKIIKPKTKKD